MANFDEFDAESQALLNNLQQNNKFLSFEDLNKGFPNTDIFNSTSLKTFDDISREKVENSFFGKNSMFYSNIDRYIYLIKTDVLLNDLRKNYNSTFLLDRYKYEITFAIEEKLDYKGDFIDKAFEESTKHVFSKTDLNSDLRSYLKEKFPDLINDDKKFIETFSLVNVEKGSIFFSKENLIFIVRIDFGYGKTFMGYGLQYDNKDNFALFIGTTSIVDFTAVNLLLGLNFSQREKDYIIKEYKDAIIFAKGKRDYLDIIYNNMPDFVLESISATNLINHIKIFLKGFVDEKIINEEKIILRIIKEIYKRPSPYREFFLNELFKIENGTTLFESLYSKIDDYGGHNNFTELMIILYKMWRVSDIMVINDEKTYNGPEVIPYESKKVLGFYNTNLKIVFEDSKVKITKNVLVPSEDGKGKQGMTTEEKTIGIYDLSQTVFIPSVNQDGEIALPDTQIPAFYLKAFDDKNIWANFDKTAWVALDVVTTFSGIGNLAKLRHLKTLHKAAKPILLASGVIQIASGVLGTMLNFVNDCSEGSFCEKLRKYLFWVDVATFSVDALTNKMLAKTAREALDDMPEPVKRDYPEIEAHLDEVGYFDNITRNLDSIRLSKLDLDEWFKIIGKQGGRVRYYTESKKMVKYFKESKVGACFDPWEVPPVIWIRKDATDLELFHESMHFEDYLRRKKGNYIRGEEREVLPFGNKIQVTKRDQLISTFIKEKYVLDKILEEQEMWFKVYGKGRFTPQEIEFSKKYFNDFIEDCKDFGIDVESITIK